MSLIDRRTLLKALGLTCALPYLEALDPTGDPSSRPKRACFVFFARGITLPPKDDTNYRTWNWFPIGTGADAQFTETNAPLEAFRDRITAISGCSHPAVRGMVSHNTADTWLTGASIGSSYDQTVSIDQLIADEIGTDTRLRALHLAVDGGIGSPGRSRTISFTPSGRPIPTQGDVVRVFNRLFKKDDAASLAETRHQIASRQSMLDVMRDRLTSLGDQVSEKDRQRLDEFTTSVRDLEKQLARDEAWVGKPKPQVDYDEARLGVDGRADPALLVQVHYDLLRLALQTDSTRVATAMMSYEAVNGSLSDMLPEYALELGSHHRLTHDKGPTKYPNWGAFDRWQNQQFASFLERMAATEDGDGSLLDRTAILFGTAGSREHVARNYGLMLAGGERLGIKHHTHLALHDGKSDQPMAPLLLTMARATGASIPSFAGETEGLKALSTTG